MSAPGVLGPPPRQFHLGAIGPGGARCAAPRQVHLGALGPPPRRVHPLALLGPDSVSARLMLNPLTLLGGPRALLLQLAHPLVAAGVADHSDFQEAPFARLVRTLAAIGTIAFADPTTSRLALDALAHTHQSVRGRSPEGVAYAAGDPRLATWVHATIVDSYLVIERRWLGWLTDVERAIFYEETLALGRAFGARVAPGAPPEDGEEGDRGRRSRDGVGGSGHAVGGDRRSGNAGVLPTELIGFETWMAARMNELVVSDQARAMSFDVLHPPLSGPWGALGRQAERLTWPFMAELTTELLPQNLREGYGLASASRGSRLRLGSTSGLLRALAPITRRSGARPDRPTRVAALLTGQQV